MIRSLDNEIRVSGHTDNVPINNDQFHSNWDLSYARAFNVMNFLVDKGNISPDKFSIQAYGQFNPKYDNSTAAGRAKNRSVDILIVRKYKSSTNSTNSTNGTNSINTTIVNTNPKFINTNIVNTNISSTN
jgi:chemotaxis protein MotB